MATVKSNASCSPSSLSVSKNSKPSGTISWSKPVVPEGATISSCVLTGTPSISNNKISATVNGTSVKRGTQFSINLGNTNATTSVNVTTSVSGNASGTVSFSNLVYTVTYEKNITYTVTFKDWDGTVLNTQTVKEGSSAAAPSSPIREGYRFIGWDKDFSSITSDLTVTAQYKEIIEKEMCIYSFDSSIDTLPVFNDGYEYRYTDVTNSDGTITRTILSDIEPTAINFRDCTGLKTLDYMDLTNLSGFDNMFTSCTSLTTVKLENCPANANTVSGFQSMFAGCTSLTHTYLSGINFENAQYMRYMFSNCSSLEYVDFGNFNSIHGLDFSSTFYYGTTGKFNTVVVDNPPANSMNKLIDLLPTRTGTLSSGNIIHNATDTSEWDIEELNSRNWQLLNDNLPRYTVTFKDWDGTVLKTETVIEGASATVPSNPSRDGYTFTGWDKDFSSITSDLTVNAQYSILYTNLVAQYTANTTGVVPTFNVDFQYRVEEINNGDGTYTSKVFCEENSTFTSCSFKGLTSLLTVDYLDITTKVSNTGAMFLRCSNLTEINTEGWDTSNVTNMKEMFAYCSSLENIDTKNLTVKSHVTLMNDMFYNCNKITSLDVNHFDVSGVSDMNEMFTNCSALTSLDLSNWNINNVTDINYLFKNCVSLTQLNISTWNLFNVIYSNMIFDSCSELKLIIMRNSDYGSINKIISNLWGFKEGSEATLDIIGVDDFSQVDVATAQSKYWNVVSGESEDGYIAKNLVSHGDWSYTFNVDWDTQYLDIEVLNYEYGLFGANYYYKISNNSYDADYSHEAADSFIIHDIEVESDQSDIDIIRYSKVDGVCIITSNGTQIIPGNSFANDNKMTVKANVITEWLNEEDGFMTFNIKITDIISSEEPDNNELVQGDINEDGTFNNESTTAVRTKYINISDKKSIQVNVLTENVYISACYLYNANKELVKVIEIPADKKRKFGVNLQELIAQIIEDEGSDQ